MIILIGILAAMMDVPGWFWVVFSCVILFKLLLAAEKERYKQ